MDQCKEIATSLAWYQGSVFTGLLILIVVFGLLWVFAHGLGKE